MNIWLLILIPLIYEVTKLILCLIVLKFGRISFDGFSSFGFKYDAKKDTFDSTKNAWQKNMGYTHLYDVLAPITGIVIDTEEIKFNYDNKNWLISFWKGQYGISTGAEIGVYYTNEQHITKNTIYFSVREKDMLNMSFILYKKGKYITQICAKHWWLATFKLGMFSKARHLSMGIRIEFPNIEMRDAFLSSFKKLRYKEKHYNIDGLTFFFNYKHPRTKKVFTKCFITDAISNFFNRKKTNIYNDYMDGLVDINGIDDTNSKRHLLKVEDLIPDMFKNDVGIQKKLMSLHMGDNYE